MEGGWFQNGAFALAPRTVVSNACNHYNMEGGWFSKWRCRLGTADLRFKSLQQLLGWRAGPFQNGALTAALRTCVFNVCNSCTGGGRAISKWGSRLGAADIRQGHVRPGRTSDFGSMANCGLPPPTLSPLFPTNLRRRGCVWDAFGG